jgi:hypothetical protein
MFTDYDRGDRKGRFVGGGVIDQPRGDGRTIPVRITLDILGGVRPEKELRLELRSLLAASELLTT